MDDSMKELVRQVIREELRVEILTGYNPTDPRPMIKVSIFLGEEEISSADEIILH